MTPPSGPPGLTIAPATPADAAAVGTVHADAWAAAFGRLFPADRLAALAAERRGRWGAVLAQPGPATVLLARLHGRPAAFVMTAPSPDRPGAAEIKGCYAHPDAWGTGAAAALLRHSLARLTAAGHPLAQLWTMRDTPQSHRFYTKHGFTASGRARERDFGGGAVQTEVEFLLALPAADRSAGG
ncbi:GNAT family N-acetyltransferase [Allonocardiopsis opalescens]|uniref:L-amino acid N-acyltransferase YncA n=1 Tax=Allonocardiopsis opalescens TaxID=1144618 RepID=A0A2T0PSF5_9ACTN|nr:GNAT family N-acetyltransferase [Allonocardiopsis opalescens]PRX91833.1 L-amino acid N-acyltransferase YncA [Allonocardiopsis opalescens]